ncbi:MAG: cold shock domain-containing protein [Alphaproteobacteria bacterium]|nr:cold shock domain-containing protein [Alphaproteobacteria bacterium]
MQAPLQIHFEHLDPSETVEARIREEAEKLEQFEPRLTTARVVVARPQRRRHHGDAFQIRLHLTVPGAADIVVSREPGDNDAHTDMYVVIRDAFSAARRQLQDLARKRQGHVKTHEEPPHGVVRALNPEADHGFIAAADGREIYFHRNSVANDGFDALSLGDPVRFSEAVGDKGPQASFVQPDGKPHPA